MDGVLTDGQLRRWARTHAVTNWSASGLGVRSRSAFRFVQFGPKGDGNARMAMVMDIARR